MEEYRFKKTKKVGILGVIGNLFLLLIKGIVRFFNQKSIYDSRLF